MSRNRQRERDRAAERRGCLDSPFRTTWGCLQTFIALYGFLTILFLLGWITVGETWSVIGYFENAIPWMAFAALALAILALLSRYRSLLIALQLPIVAVFLALYWPVLLPEASPSPGGGVSLRAVTYNTLSGQSEADAVVSVIEAIDADVIALHELGQEHADRIARDLAAQYPNQVLHPLPSENRGAGLLSRYPVLEEESFTLAPDTFIYLRVVLDVDGTPVTVFAAHPPPPEGRTIPFAYDASDREQELAALRDDYLANERGPVLLLCDCNMTDQNDDYHDMADLLDDAFWEVGQGLGFTFQSRLPLPFMRIDYVWYSNPFRALDVEVWDDAGTSDHRPIVARLELAGDPVE